jgi:hypothetical protein
MDNFRIAPAPDATCCVDGICYPIEISRMVDIDIAARKTQVRRDDIG